MKMFTPEFLAKINGERNEDEEIFVDPRAADLALELEESDRLLEVSEAGKKALENELESAKKTILKLETIKDTFKAELEGLKASLPELKSSLAEFRNVLKEERAALQQARASFADERTLRSAAEAKLAATEAQLAAERSRPASAPERIMERVKEFYPMPEPVSDYKMTVNRGRDGKIVDVMLKPVKNG